MVKLVHPCVTDRIDRESSFHHCGSPVKLVHACLSTRKELEICFPHCGGPLTLVWLPRRCCEARASLCNCQDWPREQFSPLWRSCEARASLFNSQQTPRNQFHQSGGPVKPVQAGLCAWMVSQSGFNLPISLVKLVQVNLIVRKDLERSFLHSGGPVMLVQACLCAWKSHKAVSTSREVREARASLFTC